MKQSIVDTIIEARNGQYCHCVEVNEVYELESISESIIDEFQDTHTEEEVIEFLESLTVYALDDSNEEEIYSFSFTEFVEGTM